MYELLQGQILTLGLSPMENLGFLYKVRNPIIITTQRFNIPLVDANCSRRFCFSY